MGSRTAAALCLALLAPPAPAMARPSAAKLVDLLSRAPEDGKLRILHALGRSHKPRAAVKPILALLDFKAGGPPVLAAAAEALGDLGDDRAVGPLAEGWALLAASTSAAPTPQLAVLRARIVEALGKLRGQAALPVLRAALGDPDAKVRAAAVEALGRRGDAASVEALAELTRSPDADLAQAACEALGEIGGRKAEAALSAVGADAVQPGGRAPREGSTTSPAVPGADMRPASRPTSGSASEGGGADPLLRVAADYGLARLGKKEAEGRLNDAMKGASAGPSILAAYYLVRLGRFAGLDYLVGILEDRHSALRGAAAEALGKTGNPRAALPLAQALSDPDPELRLMIVTALGRLGGQHAWYALRKARSDANPGVRGAAKLALEDLGEYEE